jgi:hypothetical protein
MSQQWPGQKVTAPAQPTRPAPAPQSGPPRPVLSLPDPEQGQRLALEAERVRLAQEAEARAARKEQRDLEETERKNLGRQEAYQRAGQTVLRSTTRALDYLDRMSQGEGTMPAVARLAQSKVPGTDEYNFTRQIEDLKRNIGLDRLQDMRDNSPTGGALGQVPVQQQAMLEDTLGSFDITQSGEILRENLSQLNNIYLDIMFGSPAERQAAVEAGRLTPEEAAEVEQYYRDTQFNMFGRKEDDDPEGALPGGDIASPGDPTITDEDIAVTQRVQSAWDRGASLDEIDALLREAGKQPLSAMEGIDDLLRRREEGAPVQWTPSPSGDTGALGDAANAVRGAIGDSGAAYAVGAANALTAGTLDELAGGNSQNAQAVKDRLRETNPVASFAGEVTGGALAMVPAARAAQALGRGALAGEVGYGAAYGAGEGNENRAAGALGGAAGAYVGNKIGGAIVERFRRGGAGNAADAATENLTPAQKMERAQRYGIDLSIGDTRGRGAKAIERGLDSQLGSAGVMEQARNRTRDQVTGALDDVASTFGGAGSDEVTGEALQRGARRWIERAKGQKGNSLDRGVVGKAYDAIPIGKDTPASVNNTVSALEEINAQFSSNPKLAALMQDTKAQRMLDALGDAGGGLSWSDLKALRSAIGEDMGPMRIAAQDSRQSTLSRLYGALSEDMRETARLRGDKALRAFERANTLNRNVEERISGALETILGRDGMQSPERAASKLRNMITSGKAGSDIKTLAEIRKSMPAAQWSEVASGLIRLAGQPAKSEGREFVPAVFARTFKDMTPAAKNLLFGKADNPLRKNLDEFVKVMDDIAASDGTRNTSNTALAQGMTLSGLGGGATGFVVGGPVGLIAGPAATQLGANVMARIWTNPGFVRWATGFARMQRGAQKAGAQPSQANIEKQIGLLDKVAKGQGPVSADIILFRDYLRNATAQSPERLAAEPTGEALPSADTRRSEDTTTAQVPR